MDVHKFKAELLALMTREANMMFAARRRKDTALGHPTGWDVNRTEVQLMLEHACGNIAMCYADRITEDTEEKAK